MVKRVPKPITKFRASRARTAVCRAFDNWDAWSGGQGDADEQEEYHAMVERARVLAMDYIADLEHEARELRDENESIRMAKIAEMESRSGLGSEWVGPRD